MKHKHLCHLFTPKAAWKKTITRGQTVIKKYIFTEKEIFIQRNYLDVALNRAALHIPPLTLGTTSLTSGVLKVPIKRIKVCTLTFNPNIYHFVVISGRLNRENMGLWLTPTVITVINREPDCIVINLHNVSSLQSLDNYWSKLPTITDQTSQLNLGVTVAQYIAKLVIVYKPQSW